MVFLKCWSLFVILSPPLAFHKIMHMCVNVHLYVGHAEKDILLEACSLGFVWLFYR